MKALGGFVWALMLVLITSFLAIILSHVAMEVGPVSTPWPRFGVIIVFFWMIHRPGIMTVPMVFVVGLTQDLILGDIPGAGVLSLMIATILLDRMFTPIRTMPLVWRWLGFAAFAGLTFALEWVLTSAARLSVQPLDLVFTQGGMTFLVYPVISIALRQFLRIGRTPRRAL